MLVYRFGEEFIMNGVLDLWGGQPGDLCTNPQVMTTTLCLDFI